MKHAPAVRAWVIAGIVGLAAGMAQPNDAGAATLQFWNDASTETTLRFTLSCDQAGGCENIFPLVDLDGPVLGIYDTIVDAANTLDGQLFPLLAGAAAELAFVNENLFLASDGPFLSGTERDMSGLESTSFSSSAAYILLVIGRDPRTALIYNGSGGLINFLFSGTSRTGSGLSHITEFGASNVIPLPATLPLFLTGLLGLAFLARRRRQMAEA